MAAPKELCTGASADCPADAFVPASTDVSRSREQMRRRGELHGRRDRLSGGRGAAGGNSVRRRSVGACEAQDVCSGEVGASATCEPRVAAAGTPCRKASCTSRGGEQAASCDGSGDEVPAPIVRGCAPYECGASACLTSCTGDGDCASGYACEEGACVFAQPRRRYARRTTARVSMRAPATRVSRKMRASWKTPASTRARVWVEGSCGCATSGPSSSRPARARHPRCRARRPTPPILVHAIRAVPLSAELRASGNREGGSPSLSRRRERACGRM